MLREAGAADRPTLLVLNKIDRLTHAEEEGLRSRCDAFLGPHVYASVVERGGLDSLKNALRAAVRARLETVRVTFPAGDGRTLAEAYREGEVLTREFVSGLVVLTARVPTAVAGRWREMSGVVVERADAA